MASLRCWSSRCSTSLLLECPTSLDDVLLLDVSLLDASLLDVVVLESVVLESVG